MPPFRHVVVVGVGLMGTSVGLALRRLGIDVWLQDSDPATVRLAASVGAGEPALPSDPDAVDLVVVGVPPNVLGGTTVDALRRYRSAVVTDLGSVKAPPAAHVVEQVGAGTAGRYVGGHPIAGSERSGPLAARADLFDGRPWAVTPHADATAAATATAERVAELCGATPVRLEPSEHDEAVARVSHLPHVAAAVVAGLLDDAPEHQVGLAGQGVRDVTRIAASDPALWTQILSANAAPVSRLLRQAATRFDELAGRLDRSESVDELLGVGVAGVRRLPGKHGAPSEDFVAVTVVLSDRPGELARLFAHASAASVNIEDLRIDHSPDSAAGLVELLVSPEAEAVLVHALRERGWALHG